jgi:uncharacterized protein YaaQ
MEIKIENHPVLLLAIVQAEDVDDALHALEKVGVFAAHLPSIGGFLGRKNATLFISTPKDLLQNSLDALQKACKQRTEYIATHLEAGTISMPMPIPITVGGATIFFISADFFEEF